jgi:ribonucleoside-diphosphate reductase alpha chain
VVTEKAKAMKFTRFFSKPDQPVTEQVEWKTVEIKVPATGEMQAVEVPAGWSDNAAMILVRNYLRKAGVPDKAYYTPDPNDVGMPGWLLPGKPNSAAKFGAETSARQVFHRMAGCWTYWGWRSGVFEQASEPYGGPLKEKFLAEDNARIFYDECYMMLAKQVGAPNSPQWFNTGLHWAYGIEGPASGQWAVAELNGGRSDVPEYDSMFPGGFGLVETTNSYERPQPHACFIQPVTDDLVNPGGIMDLWLREVRLFKYGSGTGTNFSRVRGRGEPLSGGGKSSGLMSFLRIGDRAAGSIKSGGTCLTGDTPVMTEKGLKPVKNLVGKDFLVFSLNMQTGQVVPKWAVAFESGVKECVRVTTDKGVFEVSYDHPWLTKTNQYVAASTLRPGDRLSQRQFMHNRDGYPFFQEYHIPSDYNHKGFMLVHRAIARDFKGDITGKVVHHRKDILNAHPWNLQIKTNSEHARDHSNEAGRRELQRNVGKQVAAKMIEEGTHPFIGKSIPKFGEANGMHRNSNFWLQVDKVAEYKRKQSELLPESRAREMQVTAVQNKMINLAFQLIADGYDISTFELYVKARRKRGGFDGNTTQLREIIDRRFGSYDDFYGELTKSNHKVLDVEPIGSRVVYDVQVRCSSENDRSIRDHHNFAIGSLGAELGDPWKSYVTFVHNTRRAAKMVIVDADHPEIEDFVDWKAKEEYKAAAMYVGSRLMKEVAIMPEITPPALIDRFEHGFLPEILGVDFEGEAIDTVGGQNSNNSVRVTDEFMQRVTNAEPRYDGSWFLKARTTGKTVKTIKAKDLWDRICRAAWACADPGLQFHDTINEWHTCPNDGEINASNPCSEYMFLDNTACNLASLNLVSFLDSSGTGEIDLAAFEHATRIWTVVLDISVTMASFPSREIALGSYNYRTLGLGYANLGGLLMRMAIPYDSDEGRALAAALTALMHFTAYRTSNEMAKELGPFPRWEANKEPMAIVLLNHHTELMEFEKKTVLFDTVSLIVKRTKEVALSIEANKGYRNAQVTLLAPTGTIHLIMDCDTSGIEPDFALVKDKNLAGGGTMKIVNQSVIVALKRLGYVNMAEAESQFIAYGGSVLPFVKPEHLTIFATANEIRPMAHVEMVAAVQPFLSGAVSKTINMPNNSTVEDVSHVYRRSWELGLKAVALYRDGCKLSQPLSASKPKPKDYVDWTGTGKAVVKTMKDVVNKIWNEPTSESSSEMFTKLSNLNRGQHEYLPWRREKGYTQKAKIGDSTLFWRVSEYDDGRPGEVFIELAHEGSTLRAMANCVAIAISIGLQHGTPLEQLVDKFLHTKFEPDGIVEGHDKIKFASSIADLIAKDLAITYLGWDHLAHVAGTVEPVLRSVGAAVTPRTTGDPCPDCGALLIRTGTCRTCPRCSYNEGCG